MNFIAEWLNSYRQFWELRMERLEEYVRKLQEKDKEAPGAKPPSTSKVGNDDGKH
jgi:hypothetical protein